MIQGIFRDGHPFIVLILPGLHGPLTIEFVVDTGFEGDFALPDAIARQLNSWPAGTRDMLLADGSVRRCHSRELVWDENGDDERTVEVLVLEGRPLVGTHFLIEKSIHIDVTQGGPVIVEEL
jgi:predicted aspartyl protease